MLLFAFTLVPTGVLAQGKFSLTGVVIQERNREPVSFATVSLLSVHEGGIRLVKGTTSNELGEFTLTSVERGKYILRFSAIGYKTVVKDVDLSHNEKQDVGSIQMLDSTQQIAEAVIVGDRIKGKNENSKAVYFVSKKMLAASGNTPDILRHIPGIQVDLKQNIIMDGRRNILIYVNGKERDKSYISQLNPSLIDRVEVLNEPSANYDGDVSGVINIILKEEKEAGVSGLVYADIPTSKSIVYSFPNYRIQYGFKKINLYTSYNGEINYESIDECQKRQIRHSASIIDIRKVEQVRQKNISHKFHYGFDYYLTPKNVISYYGAVNPYSYEQDGIVIMDVKGGMNRTWTTQREETDRNNGMVNSLYYKHIFTNDRREIAVDISTSHLKGNNSIRYTDSNREMNSVHNESNVGQTSTSLKVDYTTPLGSVLTFNTGMKVASKVMHNTNEQEYRCHEYLYALYGTFLLKGSRHNLNFGLRGESATSRWDNKLAKDKEELYLLPFATFQYHLNTSQSLQVTFRRSVNRPSVFYLTPYLYIDDLYSVRKGNPLLEPEFRYSAYAEHSIQFKVSYISYRLFYENISNTIGKSSVLNDSAAIEIQMQNLGAIHQLGGQFMGSIQLGPLGLSSSVRLYNQQTSGNAMARQHGIENRNSWGFDAGISMILSLNHDFALSGSFQYSTAKYGLQDNAFCDALYMLSFDKSFKSNFKVGVATALPFAKRFVYQGSDVDAPDFSNHYRGNLKLPSLPLMLRATYQFRSGKEKVKVSRDVDEPSKKAKPGF